VCLRAHARCFVESSVRATREGITTPRAGFTTSNGTSIELVNCVYVPTFAPCVAAGFATQYLVGVTSARIYGDNIERWFVVASNGTAANRPIVWGWNATNSSSPDPRSAAWYTELTPSNAEPSGGGFVSRGYSFDNKTVVELYALPLYVALDKRCTGEQQWTWGWYSRLPSVRRVSNGQFVGAAFASAPVSRRTSCENSCRSNSFAKRGGLAAAKDVFSLTNSSSGAPAALSMSNPDASVAWASIKAVSQSLYSTWLRTRSSLKSPPLGYGNVNGTYIEVVNCLYYGSADSACTHTPPSYPHLVLVVSPSFFGDSVLHYYRISSTSMDVTPFFNDSYVYDPRTRPWYKDATTSTGGFGAPFVVAGVTTAMTTVSFSVPVYLGAPTAPQLAGVAFATLRRDSEVACASACQGNAAAVR